jgi:hypothetical protein
MSSDLMRRFGDDERIFAICAWNIVDQHLTKIEDYFFTRYFSGGGGFCVTKQKWEIFKNSMNQNYKIPLIEIMRFANYNILIFIYYVINIRIIRETNWDYEILKYLMKYKKLNIFPVNNMANNVGTGNAATHTKHLPSYKIHEIDTNNLYHPLIVQEDGKYGKYYRRARLKLLFKAILYRLKSTLDEK